MKPHFKLPLFVFSILLVYLLISGILHLNPALAGPALSEKVLKALQQDSLNTVRTQRLTLKQGDIYYVMVPSSYAVVPVQGEKLQTIDQFAQTENSHVLAVINAGYFDPQNQKTISYITQNGAITADPTKNERLTQNPNLKPYLAQIFNRSEFRYYMCLEVGSSYYNRYDIVPHKTPTPEGCALQFAVGGGPQLLPTDRSKEEAVVDYNKAGKITRDPFGIKAPNARSAVGITENGSVILLMGAQVPERQAYGFTFEQLKSLLTSLGAKKALALDGGSSSAMMIRGLVSEQEDAEKASTAQATSQSAQEAPATKAKPNQIPVIYGKYSKNNQPVKRPVKSVLMILAPQPQVKP